MSEETTPPDLSKASEAERETERVSEKDRVSRLIAMAVELTSEVEELAQDSGQQFTSLARTARRNRLMIWGIIAGGCLDIILTVVMFMIGSTAINNTERIDRLTADLQVQQTDQRKRALCPLYGIFLDSKSDAGRNAAPDKEKYDHAFEVIEEGYFVLGCEAYLKESGRDAW